MNLPSPLRSTSSCRHPTRLRAVASLAPALALAVLLAACGGGGGASGGGSPGVSPPANPPPSNPPPSNPPPTDPPPGSDSATGLDPNRAPARNFDLSRWKITLPTGLEVKTVELNTDFELPEVFHTDRASGGMVFRTPNIGGTTINSSFSRTELREVLAPTRAGADDANNWTPEQGGVLRATLRIDRVSTTGDARMMGRVVLGQIHAFSTQVMRLHYDKKPHEARGKIIVAMQDVDATTHRVTLVDNSGDSGIALGERFSYEIALQHLSLTVMIRREQDGRTWTMERQIDPGYLGRRMYFKAGVYSQNNTGELTDYTQATFFALRHLH